MKRSMSSDHSRFGRWDNDSNRPYKKLRDSSAEKDDADSSNSNRCVPESDWWVVTSFLGKGSYGSVYLAVRTAEGEEDSFPKEMAIKTIEFSKASRLENEVKYLTRLRKNPFIVSYFGNVTTQDKQSNKMLYNTIFEYCPGQCLAKHIKGGGLVEDDVKRFSVDILIGLNWIHEKKIIHGDIKPKNILLAADVTGLRDNGYMAKISGFGRAMEKGSSEYGEGWGHRRGTTRFMSPELVVDMFLDYGADVWAFGCTVLEMLTGERVWGEHSEHEWEDWITLIGESGQLPYVPDSLSKKAKNFLSKCLERDPARRWTVDRLMEHPFLTRNNEISEEEEEEEEEAYEPYIEDEGDADIKEEEEEEEEELEEIEDVDVDAYEAYLAYGEPFEEEEAATEIDEEYPINDSEEDE